MICHREWFLWSRDDVRVAAESLQLDPIDLLDAAFDPGEDDCVCFVLMSCSPCPFRHHHTHECTAGPAMPLYCRSRLHQSLALEDALP